MDISLFYQETGEGEPFIFLHGNGDNGDCFINQAEYFSAKYRVITVDTRGHGRSPRGSAPFTMEQFADDLACLMSEMNISNAIILGFSDGANIAMKFALKYPAMVKALILNSGNLNTKGVKRSFQIPIEIGYRTAKLFGGKSEGALRNAEILGLMVNEPNIAPDRLSAVTAPTLVIAGTDDMIKREHTEEIARNIPNSRLVFIKGNHGVIKQAPTEFNKAVEHFLQTVL